MRIAIAGGGTGGHLSVGRALGLECKKQGIYSLYIGSNTGQDRSWFADSDVFCEKLFLDSVPVVNQKGPRKAMSVLQNVKQALKARQALKDNNISACVSVGGFSAAAGSFGAIAGRIPLFVHEQNARIGALNKVLNMFCSAFFRSFEDASRVYVDYPVGDEFFDKQRVRKQLNVISFMGGSQGASAINKLAMRLAPLLRRGRIKMIHQTGKTEFSAVKDKYTYMGFDVTDSLQNLDKSDVVVIDFARNVSDIFSKSDFCVSRAGASSVFELSANMLPSLFIPYPFAAGDHQFYNVQALRKKNLALVMRQEEIEGMDSGDLLDRIAGIELEKVSWRLRGVVNRGGQRRMLAFIRDYLAAREGSYS